jgi:hypothetical protein
MGKIRPVHLILVAQEYAKIGLLFSYMLIMLIFCAPEGLVRYAIAKARGLQLISIQTFSEEKKNGRNVSFGYVVIFRFCDRFSLPISIYCKL